MLCTKHSFDYLTRKNKINARIEPKLHIRLILYELPKMIYNSNKLIYGKRTENLISMKITHVIHRNCQFQIDEMERDKPIEEIIRPRCAINLFQ